LTGIIYRILVVKVFSSGSRKKLLLRQTGAVILIEDKDQCRDKYEQAKRENHGLEPEGR
jgi:hypothetical protein